MKSTYKLLAFLVVGCGLFLTNCKDEETVTPDNRTKVELMLNGAWKWTASTCDVEIDIDGMNGASKDVHSQYPACFKDDTYTFNKDSTTTETSNVKCTSEATTIKNAWIFTNGEKNLQWKGKDFKTRQYIVRDYTIIELTGSKLVLQYNEIASPKNYVITNTYTH